MDVAGENRLYGDLAHLWPLISPPEGYAAEAVHWREALRAALGPGRHRLLELGVGGGHNLSHLTGEFDATAVDISPEMLRNSERLNPGVDHHVGDMRTVRLRQTFDAVIVHDAIAYMLDERDLSAVFGTAHAHLEPGGTFITAPDWFRDTFPGPQVSHQIRRAEDIELAFIEYTYDPDPADTTVETVFLYVISEEGRLRVEEDRHVTGLFPLATWLRLMEEAGFDVSQRKYPVHDDGHEAWLLVGARR